MPRKNRTISHAPRQLVHNCHNKRQYASERQAKEVAEDQMLLHSTLELRVYKCPLGHHWHLTKASSK